MNYNNYMDKIDKEKLKNKIETTLPILNEYQLRMYLASEAKALGHGGISLVSRISGVSIATIRKGINTNPRLKSYLPIG